MLKKAVDLLMEKKPVAIEEENNSREFEKLITVFYDQYIRKSKTLQETWKLPFNNVVVCSDPDISMDFKSAFEEAKTLFYKCEPVDAEFMPAAEQEPEDDD